MISEERFILKWMMPLMVERSSVVALTFAGPRHMAEHRAKFCVADTSEENQSEERGYRTLTVLGCGPSTTGAEVAAMDCVVLPLYKAICTAAGT